MKKTNRLSTSKELRDISEKLECLQRINSERIKMTSSLRDVMKRNELIANNMKEEVLKSSARRIAAEQATLNRATVQFISASEEAVTKQAKMWKRDYKSILGDRRYEELTGQYLRRYTDEQEAIKRLLVGTRSMRSLDELSVEQIAMLKSARSEFLRQEEAISRIAESVERFSVISPLASEVSLHAEQFLRNEIATNAFAEYNKMRRFYESISLAKVSDIAALRSVPSLFVERTDGEFYRTTRLVQLPITEEVQSIESDTFLTADIGKPSTLGDVILKHLITYNGSLSEVYEGALEGFYSTKPDSDRHFCASMEVIITQLLHRLSPDQEFNKWEHAAEHLDDRGKPTRVGRLQYICRNVRDKNFANLIDKDVSACVSIINLLQKGRHRVKSPFEPGQRRIIKLKCDSLILYILEFASFEDR